MVEVAVTLPVPGRYHYSVPDRFVARARIGARVLVPFGNRKVTGVVVREDTLPPEGVTAVDVSDVLDTEPSLPRELVELCLWVADYYEAPPGEVMRAALPAGSGVAARTIVSLTDAGRAALAGEGTAIPPKQMQLLAKLVDGPRPSAGMSEAVRRNIDALRERGLVEQSELRDRARTQLKKERVAALADGVGLEQARAAAGKSAKRLAVVDAIVAAGGTISVPALSRQVASAAVAVRELATAGVARIFEREQALEAVTVGTAMNAAPIPKLTDEQERAVEAITEGLRTTDHGPRTEEETGPLVSGGPRPEVRGPAPEARGLTPDARRLTPFLLHGVTGSGKTEVYLRVIARALEVGRTAIVLVPEISLTPQLAARFRARFGDRVAILHSGLSEQARLGEWSRLHRGEARIAVGARSAVFAPLRDVGVIVVDEEHDGSFKQEEGVRYHARDVALVRAQRAGAVCVLGSATPSLESFHHAERGQYRLLELTQRPTARPMPSVEVIDLRTHMPDGEAMLSAPLRAAIAETLAAGDQTILFLNRRGFATFVLCRGCGHSFRCENCSVSLTYHRHSDRLSCHYCGYQARVPETCPKCGAKDSILRKGLGTEKIADALAEAFPAARVARLDRDVATGAKIEAVLSRVARREVDILVGTQMVTKGHDFPGVTLVGVLCADTGLNLPDFRASERTFQLLAQVAGRAGRGDRPGRVIVQTYRPESPAVTSAAAHDYASFYRAELAERADLAYPPHGRLIAVRIDGGKPREVSDVAHRLAQLADVMTRRPDVSGVEILGPVAAPLERLRGRTRWQIWLRGTERQALRRVARGLLQAEVPSSVRVGLDVDPLSTL